jgi:hypothetical protein
LTSVISARNEAAICGSDGKLMFTDSMALADRRLSCEVYELFTITEECLSRRYVLHSRRFLHQ